jgi:hypothetical protein
MLPEPGSFAPWIALVVFAFTTTITPGPNNLMLTVTGAQFGLRAAVPAIAGILMGMSLLIGLASAGAASLLLAFPGLELGLAWGRAGLSAVAVMEAVCARRWLERTRNAAAIDHPRGGAVPVRQSQGLDDGGHCGCGFSARFVAAGGEYRGSDSGDAGDGTCASCW